MDALAEFRAAFPAVAGRCYLNTAGGSPLSTAAHDAVRAFLEQQLTGGDIHWPAWTAQVESVRRSVADFVNASPDEIAFLTSASLASNTVAQLCAQSPGHTILYRREFPSTSLPWLQRRMPITWLEPEPDGDVSIDAILAAIRSDTRYIVISHVQYLTGFRIDLEALCAETSHRRLRLIVDATQSLGAETIDLSELAIDALWAGGYKYLGAGYGIAPLFVRQSWLEAANLPAVGWRSLADPSSMVSDRLELSCTASALELGHPPFSGTFALGGALEVINAAGIDQISSHVERLSDYLRDRASAEGISVQSARSGPARSWLVFLEAPVPNTPAQLLERGIFVGDAPDAVRVSVHAYNTHADIDCLVSALKELKT